MVDIKKGQTDKNASSELLINFFKKQGDLEGKLYIGYPILYAGGENIILDALWISENKGIIIFDLIEGLNFENRERVRDSLYNKIESELKQYESLNKGRKLLVDIEVITYAPACREKEVIEKYTSFNDKDLIREIESVPDWDNSSEEIFRKALSVIQSVIKIKTQVDRSYVKKDNSRGAIVKRLEETIANLDNQQEEAIIEYHDGLQRIRGLAGSGKTIVLALKAAYLHAINPDWNIIVTFNTRSLKNQFKELIELFCIQKMGRKPNKDKIRIIQAWGGSRSTGVYYEFCKDNGIEYLDVRAAKPLANKLGTQPFDAVCKKALESIEKSKIKPSYDVILVDEAQDLSESFLNLCFVQLTKKKRLIYAYDELQKLNIGSSLRNPNKIFGQDASDIILKKCYRNSRPVLVTAHALGFGIYHNKGLVQFFDQPALWNDVGYLVKEGVLKAKEKVTLTRANEATHKFLEQEINLEDIIQFKTFTSKQAQAKAIADDIEKNLKKEELLHRDIIVINPLALTTKKEVAMIRALLDSKGIRSHIAGDVDKDEFYRDKSIAFTGINRAKGNEVPYVYIMNGQDCYSHPIIPNRGLRERRNILFTAITRSKAWVRVFGVGNFMNLLEKEFNLIKEKKFELSFTYPTQEEIDKMNVISRDLTITEEIQLKTDIDSLSNITNILQRIDSGENQIEDYPEEMQAILKLLKK
ncbi:DEAD/DEAH box helicase [Aquimarina sp. U1-2]|uniref:DEAD/DEAH box helicase n=1 Tax=Aquimarina sp. U1-2 TaxID=2823141 RepID=UPI001AED0BA6|nr:ATP-binding domain-containing protein [Aquimarina sp. U1-2]MBP2833811.1 DEAD/DEAH box helicase [Aquimarina sp. U1-2]